jgi:hypothetical protein
MGKAGTLVNEFFRRFIPHRQYIHQCIAYPHVLGLPEAAGAAQEN